MKSQRVIARQAVDVTHSALRWTALPASGSMLFESARTHPLYGTRTLLCMGSLAELRLPANGGRLEMLVGGRRKRLRGNPLRALAEEIRLLMKAFGKNGGAAPPAPVAAGYLAYEAGRFAEKMPPPRKDGPGLPEICFIVPAAAALHMHGTGTTWLYGYGKDAERRLDIMEAALSSARRPDTEVPRIDRLESNFRRKAYLAAVERVKAYIAAGDIYQTNLSQQFRTQGKLDPRAVYLDLCERSPAPFFAWLDLGRGQYVLSSSMELFLLTHKGKAITRPIKGTRPRGDSPEEDEHFEKELSASVKDRAELTMIVDLERNDLGRVCEYGTVHVPSLHLIEKHPHVHHLVATVEGRLHKGNDVFDLLRATFPGGSITGAPKVRSMEIIHELEPTRRSVYCGSIGFLDAGGNASYNIAIRTILLEGDTAWFSVGGGLTSDSDPAAEYQETLDKARGMALALGLKWPPSGLSREDKD